MYRRILEKPDIVVVIDATGFEYWKLGEIEK